MTSLDQVRRGLSANRPWGRMEMTPEQYLALSRRGSLRIRVYPPGTTKRQRAMLWARYGLTSWMGAGIAFTAAVLLGVYAGLGVALGALLVTAAAVWLLSARVAGRVRQVCFPLVVMKEGRGRGGVYVAARRVQFEALALQLNQIDIDSSDLSPVDYEVRWGLVYDQLEASQ